MPKPLHIRIIYKGKVAHITGTETEEVVVSEGFVFVELLREIFISHPEIEKTFPPGHLGLVINGRPPTVQQALRDGDVIVLTSVGPSTRIS